MTTEADLRTLTIEQVAAILKVRPEAVRLFVKQGRLRGFRWGRRLHVKPEDVARFQAAALVKPVLPPDPLARARRQHRESLREAGQ